MLCTTRIACQYVNKTHGGLVSAQRVSLNMECSRMKIESGFWIAVVSICLAALNSGCASYNIKGSNGQRQQLTVDQLDRYQMFIVEMQAFNYGYMDTDPEKTFISFITKIDDPWVYFERMEQQLANSSWRVLQRTVESRTFISPPQEQHDKGYRTEIEVRHTADTYEVQIEETQR